MKVVVTGAAGQLGSLVLERLVVHSEIERITALDLVAPRVPGSKIQYRMVDLKDPGVERHLEGADALVHLAFVVARPMPVEQMRAVNVDGTRRLFEAAARHAIRRIVYTSSVAAYGLVSGHPVPIVETTPRRRTPYLAYADHKWEVEEFLDAFERAHVGVDVVRLRPGLLLGRRIPHVKESLLRRKMFPVTAGAASPPIVWDADVADAIVIALCKPGVRGAFNLVAEDPLAPQELVRLADFRAIPVPPAVLAAAQGVTRALARAKLRHGHADWVQAAQAEQVISAAKARTELGWQPRHPTAADVAVAFGRHARSAVDGRLTLFLRLVDWASRSSAVSFSGLEVPRKLRVHLDVTGPTGADFALTVDRGTVALRPGIPRPPDSVVTLSADTLMKMIDPEQRTADLGERGEVRIQGDPAGWGVLRGTCDAIVTSTDQSGLRGRAARALSRWIRRSPRS